MHLNIPLPSLQFSAGVARQQNGIFLLQNYDAIFENTVSFTKRALDED